MTELLLYGTVGSSFWDEDYFTAKQVRDQLAGLSGPLTVRLNSGGGIATEGQAIYTALRGYDGPVTVIVEGIAASAASLVAMAGDTITMSMGAVMMIHDPATWYVEGRGTEEDHLQAANSLRVIANAYAGIYAKRAAISVDEAREIMKSETYFDGLSAVEAGFATIAEGDGDETAPAAFDYRLYAKAPADLRARAGELRATRARASVFAMMAGAPNPNGKKERTMGKPNMTKITASDAADTDELAEEDDVTASQDDQTDEVAEETDEVTAEETDDAGEDKEEDGASPAEALAIVRMCARQGLSSDRAADFLARGLTCREAVAELNGKGSKVKMTNHAPRARILRDERDTRRTAMSAAIVAQISGAGAVDAASRPFMDLSLVEMAAQCIGHRGPIRNSGQRLDVMMAASHATSDFPAIFQNALNKQLQDRYALAVPTYRAISKKKNFRDFRPMPLVRAGDFPMLKPISETGEIKFGTFGESGEQALISSYAVGVTISRQMIINDDLGAIDEVLSSYGETVAFFEEKTFYAYALSAQMADGKTLFHADHGNLATTAAAINTASVSKGRAAMRKQKSIDGNTIMSNAPSILLCGPDKETEAEMFLASITPTATSDVNPFSGKLTPVVTSEITGNPWYLLSAANPCFVHGFLEGAEAPRLRTEEPFGTQGFSMTLEHDFGMGAVDHRGGYKNAGA
ncbi:head maturation protease, ClpP-related [Albirhodobacter sp. R86504]|uniref:head maturation protease, ClpP-related n=1 Tax=Albirhodobacter sp. R86504 TaxID=3093848 RepID=UPI00366A93B2